MEPASPPSGLSRHRSPATLKMLLGTKSSESGFSELAGVFTIWLLGSVVVLRKALITGKLFELQCDPSQWNRWLALALQYPVLVALHSSVVDATGYLQSRITSKWRRNVTRKIHNVYFQRVAYYRVQIGAADREAPITDGDTRICRDIWEMANATSESAVSLIEALVKTSVFTGAAIFHHHWAWALCPPALFLAALHVVLKTQPSDGITVGTTLQHVEGRLKQTLFRLHSRLESVLMLQGEAFELDSLQKSVKEILTLTKRKYDAMFFVEMAKWVFFYPMQAATMTELVAFFTSAFMGIRGIPNGDKQSVSAAELIGRQLTNVQEFFNAYSALGTFLGAHRSLMNSNPATSRVKQSYARLERLQSQAVKVRARRRPVSKEPLDIFVDKGPVISFESVTIHTPSKQTLLRDLSFKVSEGCPLLICGQVGAGKSAVARCLSSLWPVTAGLIARPGGCTRVEDCVPLPDDILYLPERPTTGIASSLAEEITFPALSKDLSGKELQQWLRCVGLEHLSDFALSEEKLDWSSLLSLADEQALGFARLLYHRPRFAVLDETTSAMSAETEEHLLLAAREVGICCITISRKAGESLRGVHGQLLQLQGARGEDTRGWKLLELPGGKQLPAMKPRCETSSEAFLRLESGCREEEAKQQRRPPSAQVAGPVFGLPVAEAVCSRWPSQMSRFRATLGLGLLTSGRRRAVLQKAVLILLLLHARTKVYWCFCRGLAGMCRALLLRDHYLALKKLLSGGLLVFLGGLADQILRHQANNATLELWAGAMSHLQRKLLRELTLPRVEETAEALQRLAELRGLFEALGLILCDALQPVANLSCMLPAMVRSLGALPLAIISAQLLIFGSLQSWLTAKLDAAHGQMMSRESKFQALHGRLRSNSEHVAHCSGGPLYRQVLGPQLETMVEDGLRAKLRELPGRIALTFLVDFRQLPSWISRMLSFRFVTRMFAQGRRSIPSVDALCAAFFFDRITQASQVAVQGLVKSTEKVGRLDSQCKRCLELVVACEAASKKQPLSSTGSMASSATTLPLGSSRDEVSAPALSVTDRDLLAKDGSVLARKLTLDIVPGKPMIVTGPAGCGKSVLSRLLLGLSTRRATEAELGSLLGARPSRRVVMGALQEPYLPNGCRFLALLAYPSVLRLPSRPPFTVQVPNVPEAISKAHLVEHFHPLGATSCQIVQMQGSRTGLVGFRTFEETVRAVARPQDRVINGVELECELGGVESDDSANAMPAGGPDCLQSTPQAGELLPRLMRMRRCLRAVSAEQLLTREQEGWFSRRAWQDVLSLEEQQKLSLARVLYHQPAFCVLDDATSAIPSALESALHKKLQEWEVTPVTMARHSFLKDFYQCELRLGVGPDGSSSGWELLAAEKPSEGLRPCGP